MTPEAVTAFLGSWGYPAFLLLILLTAIGSPITEDLLLLAGGYLIGAHVFSWPVALPVAFAGVVTTDAMLHTYGRKLREHSLRRGFIRRIIRPGRLRLATRWFGRLGDWLVVVSRFVPGTRVLVFVSAGLRGMALWRFLLLDALAAAAWVPLLLWLGERLGQRIGGLHRVLNLAADRALQLVALVAAAYVLRRLWLRRERKLVGSLDAEP
jgi:membrane protein DedA with SNARE-associated domain